VATTGFVTSSSNAKFEVGTVVLYGDIRPFSHPPEDRDSVLFLQINPTLKRKAALIAVEGLEVGPMPAGHPCRFGRAFSGSSIRTQAISAI
jgi:hypothetical protein